VKGHSEGDVEMQELHVLSHSEAQAADGSKKTKRKNRQNLPATVVPSVFAQDQPPPIIHAKKEKRQNWS
jgi:hypothetical protein